MESRDFVLDLTADEGDGYVVRVRSPDGEGKERCHLPPELKALPALWSGTGRHPGGGRTLRPAVARKGSRAPVPGAEGVGRRLFETFVQGTVRDRYLGSRRLVRAEGRRLRIRLELDPTVPRVARLQALPWELLHDGEGFLALDRRISVTRYLAVPQPILPASVERPDWQRVLVVMAAPADAPSLDLEDEWRAVEASWAGHGAVEVRPLLHARLDTLRQALHEAAAARRGVHVLHFMGHGVFDGERGEGALLFEDEDGGSREVSGPELAEHLGGFEDLRLVCLNACQSADATSAGTSEPFAGVAGALVRAGVLAVVATQAPVADPVAIKFSETFYYNLAADGDLEAAVTEGRLAVRRRWRRGADWAQEVLFLRGDGQLFRRAAEEESAPRRAPRVSWHPGGLAALAAGTLGGLALAALAALGLAVRPGLLPAAAGALALLLTVLSFHAWSRRRTPSPHAPPALRVLSHRLGRSPAGLSAGTGLALAAFAAWGLAGPKLLCAARCPELGCPPPGVTRLAIGDVEAVAGVPAELAEDWTRQTREALVTTLRRDGVEVLGVKTPLEPEVVRRCADVVVHGTVARRGRDDLELSVHLTDGAGVSLGEESILEPPDVETGTTLVRAHGRLAQALLERLPVLWPELAAAAEGWSWEIDLPTADPEALALNNEGALLMDKDPEWAREKFKAALKRDRGYADPHNNLGFLARREARYEAALRHIRRAWELRPRDAFYAINLGDTYLLQGDLTAAVETLTEAVALDPGYAKAHNVLGYVHLLRGDAAAARRSVERGLGVVDLDDEGLAAALLKNRGRVALLEDEPRAAVRFFDQALELTPCVPEAYLYRAYLLGERESVCRDLLRYRLWKLEDPESGRREELAAELYRKWDCDGFDLTEEEKEEIHNRCAGR